MKNLGKKIKEFRLSKGWTLADLSKRSGVALSSLSRMETGRMTGTLHSHLQIAKSLGAQLAELYAELEPSAPSLEVRSGRLDHPKVATPKGDLLTVLAQNPFKKKMLPALLNLSPGKETSKEHAPAGVEGFLYVLKGRIDLTVGKEKASLSAGNSAYYQAWVSHALKNPGPGSASVLRVTHPPSL